MKPLLVTCTICGREFSPFDVTQFGQCVNCRRIVRRETQIVPAPRPRFTARQLRDSDLDRFDKVYRSLSHRERTAFVYHLVLGYTQKEVAAHLGVSQQRIAESVAIIRRKALAIGHVRITRQRRSRAKRP